MPTTPQGDSAGTGRSAGPPAGPDNPTAKPAATTTAEAPPVLTGPSTRPVSDEELHRLVSGVHHDPHSLLGPHPHDGGVTVRTLRPWATSVRLAVGDERVALRHESYGVWVGVLPGPDVPDYRIEVAYDGPVALVDDPYRFLPTLGEIDLHLIGEGRHEELWTVLGAHVRSYDGIAGTVHGTSFAVWAPSAQGVRLTGDFNYWDGRAHPMRSMGSTGVWELFVPGIGDGTHYKFEVLGQDGVWRQKADPLAFRAEVPPATASVVFTPEYEWGDGDWLQRRAQQDPLAVPMSVYEVHLGSWRQGLSYRELAEQLVGHVQLPRLHPHRAAARRRAPVRRLVGLPGVVVLRADLTVRLPRTTSATSWTACTRPASASSSTGCRRTSPRTPGRSPASTARLSTSTRTRAAASSSTGAPTSSTSAAPRSATSSSPTRCTGCEEFHIDGLRVDAVASMLYLDYSREEGQWEPNEFGGRENLEAVSFLQEANATAYKRVPGIVTIAEESTAWPGVTRPTHLGGLGFGFKWNMGWMHDSLGYMANEPIYRQYHHHQMTFSLVYAYSEHYVLPISHDEVVHGKGSLLRKMPGDRWQQLANLRAYLAFMWAHPGKQLLFMGSEFGQESEWAESRSLDWWLTENPDHRGVQTLVHDLNRVYADNRGLWSRDSDPDGFGWIDANDAGNNVFSFLRWGDDGSVLACVANFSPMPHEGYRLGLPFPGRWDEVLNTDAEAYVGSGVGNLGGVEAAGEGWHGQPASASLRVPPLGTVWLRHSPA